MGLNRATAWKLVGIAGVVGVAATGVLVARSERQRRAYTPDEVRERLHERYAQVADSPRPESVPPGEAKHRVHRAIIRVREWRRRDEARLDPVN